MEKFQVRNSLIPADRSHAPFIEIPKWLWLFTADHSQNIAGGVAALLHRHWRDSRQRLASLMRKICQITNHLHFRMSGDGEVVIHNDATNAINRYAERFPDERR